MENLISIKLSKWFFSILCLYLFALTCSTAGMELAAALLSLTTVYWITRALIRKNSLKALRFQGDYFLWCFVGTILLGAIFIPDLTAYERKEVVRASRFILTLYALIVALWAVKKNAPARYEGLLKLLFSCMLIVASYGILQFFTGIDLLRKAPYGERALVGFDLFRVKGFYTNTMSYSYLIGMLFCLLAAFAYFRAVRFKNDAFNTWFMRLAPAIILLSLFMTFTRGLWIALVAAILVMSFMISWKLSAKVALGVVLLFTVLIVSSQPIRNRLAGVVALDSSNSQRLLIWQNHWEMFKDHPFMGVGFEQNSRLMQEYNLKLFGKEWRVVHAHNHFLQTLTGVGIFGFAFFILFFGSMYWLAIKLWLESSASDLWSRAVALGSVGAQTVFHVGGLSEAVFSDRESNHAILLILALTIVSYQAIRRTGLEKA